MIRILWGARLVFVCGALCCCKEKELAPEPLPETRPVEPIAPVPKPVPLTLATAAKMTLDERLIHLRASCLPSGICVDEVVDLLKSAGSPDDSKAIDAAVDAHAAPFVAKLNESLIEYTKLEKLGRTWTGDETLCLQESRRAWEILTAHGTVLRTFAFTLPAAGELRDATGSLRNCVALCSTRPERREFCDDASKSLAEARADLKAGKNL